MAQYYEKERCRIIEMLVKERKSQELTQSELAGIIGIQRSNLSRFEKAQANPSPDLVIKIADALGARAEIVPARSDRFDTAPLTERTEDMQKLCEV